MNANAPWSNSASVGCPELKTVTTHTFRFRRPCFSATISAVRTAVGASDVAGDTPWTNLGPNFHGNLFIIAIPYPPHNPPSHQFCETVLEPRGACFCASQANHGGYSPLLSLICPCQTFRSTKATPPADFGGDLLTTFSIRLLPNQLFFGGSLLHSTPVQL